MNPFVSILWVVGSGGIEIARRAIYASMMQAPVQRVFAVREFALHPFQVAQPGTIGEFVKHSGRDVIRLHRNLLRVRVPSLLFIWCYSSIGTKIPNPK